MARDLTSGFLVRQQAPARRSRPQPKLDRSERFDAEGQPVRPVDDIMTANHMLRRGFSKDDVRHVLGYLPDLDGEGQEERPGSHSR